MTTAQPDPIAEDLRAIELASVATSIAKAAQPGQEQRMELIGPNVSADYIVLGDDALRISRDGTLTFRDATEATMALKREWDRTFTRPIADLGEDGVDAALSAWEAGTADAAETIEALYDRLILYREALELRGRQGRKG